MNEQQHDVVTDIKENTRASDDSIQGRIGHPSSDSFLASIAKVPPLNATERFGVPRL